MVILLIRLYSNFFFLNPSSLYSFRFLKIWMTISYLNIFPTLELLHKLPGD